MLSTLQNILDILNHKLFNNIVTGQNIVVANANFDIQMNKMSSNNPKRVCVRSAEAELLNKRNKFNRIRNLQASEDCGEESVLGLDKKLINEVMKNETSPNLGFQSQFNKNKNLPIETNAEREVFSETSLEFGLSKGDSNEKMRMLQQNNLNLNFEIRLKIPHIKAGANVTDVGDTACVQYSMNKKKNPDVSCESWYSELTSEVVCVCNKQGLTVNVMDKGLSNIGKLGQFPGLGAEICNKLNYKRFLIIFTFIRLLN